MNVGFINRGLFTSSEAYSLVHVTSMTVAFIIRGIYLLRNVDSKGNMDKLNDDA